MVKGFSGVCDRKGWVYEGFEIIRSKRGAGASMQTAEAATSSPSQQYGSHLPIPFTVLRETDRTEYLEFPDKTVCV